MGVGKRKKKSFGRRQIEGWTKTSSAKWQWPWYWIPEQPGHTSLSCRQKAFQPSSFTLWGDTVPTQSLNYLTGLLAGWLGHGVYRASSLLMSQFLLQHGLDLAPTELEQNPHPLIKSQDQLAASVITQLTARFSFWLVCIPMLIKTRCYVMGIIISSLWAWFYRQLIYNEMIVWNRNISSRKGCINICFKRLACVLLCYF